MTEKGIRVLEFFESIPEEFHNDANQLLAIAFRMGAIYQHLSVNEEVITENAKKYLDGLVEMPKYEPIFDLDNKEERCAYQATCKEIYIALASKHLRRTMLKSGFDFESRGDNRLEVTLGILEGFQEMVNSVINHHKTN